MSLDVLLVHPPAIYDFRKKTIFPGVLGSTVEHIQFIKPPLGMLSIADYLDRHGCRVMLDNLADRMVSNREFDAEEHIRNSPATIYAIDLHFHHHAQGAIEVARLCKEAHPGSPVVIGGLTATCYHEEIINKYDFVDAVIRGEGEKPMLQFVEAYKKNGRISDTPSLTYRTDSGEVRVTPLMEASTSLDEFEFLRFDLLEPKTAVFTPEMQTRWSLQVCRGCCHCCVTCGGSAYSYKKYFGMDRPSFRSPEKLISDIKKLNQWGIRRVGLYQDPRMAGEQYWRELMAALRREKLDIEQLTMDLLAPADEEFIREVATIGKPVILYICPDTGDCDVRQAQGRLYSNEELLDTISICHRYHIPITVFLSVGLAGESHETMAETWQLWDKLCSLDKLSIARGGFGDMGRSVLRGGPIIGPIILEPGSLSFDYPEKHGYKLSFGNLEEYREALSRPSWHQWLNHETEQLSKDALIELILESIEQSTKQRAKYGSYNKREAIVELLRTRADRVAAAEVSRIMELADADERKVRLEALKQARGAFLGSPPFNNDTYGYREMIWKNCFHASHS